MNTHVEFLKLLVKNGQTETLVHMFASSEDVIGSGNAAINQYMQLHERHARVATLS